MRNNVLCNNRYFILLSINFIVISLFGMDQNVLDKAISPFGCYAFSAGEFGSYFYVYGENLLQGKVETNFFGIPLSLKDWESSQNKQNLMKKLVGQYKVHLVSENQEAIAKDVTDLLQLVRNNVTLQKSIYSVMVRSVTLRKEIDRMPTIIITCAQGKNSAQQVINILFQVFQTKQGLGCKLPYNQKVTSYIYYAQGNSDDKKIKELEQYFEQPAMVHYKADVTGKKEDYSLILPTK